MPKYLTRLYKLGIKTGVWYPKMYIWSLKMEKFLLFTLKMKFLFKNLTRLYKLGIKTGVWYPKNVHLVPKNGKICTFYTKNEVFAQKFDPSVQIGDKNWSLVPQNVLFTLKMKFLLKNLTRLYKLGIKTGVWYPKMHIWSLKMKKFVLFTLKMKFCPNI